MKVFIIFTFILFSTYTAIAQWTQTSMDSCYIRCLATDGINIFAGTDGNGLFASNDFGSSWNSINTGLSSDDIWSLNYSNNKLYAGTTNGIYLSIDSGNTWNSISNNLQSNQKVILSIEVVDTLIFIGTANGYGEILRANTNNYTWSLKYSIAPCIPAIYFYSGRIFASIEVGGIISSDNYGDSWTECENGLTGIYVLHDLVSKDTIVYAALHYKGLYKYYTNLNIWVPSGLQNVTYLNSVQACDSFIVTSSIYDNEGVFISYDHGNSWDTINDGLISKNITALLINNNCLYAGTNGFGIWKRELITSNKIENITNANVFPNPGKGIYKISFSEKIKTSIDIKLYNCYGSEIFEKTFKSFSENLIIDISHVPNGIYVLETTINDRIYIKKIIKQR